MGYKAGSGVPAFFYTQLSYRVPVAKVAQDPLRFPPRPAILRLLMRFHRCESLNAK